MKTCRTCNIEKNENDFQKNKSNRDGFNTQCLLCVSEYKKIYYIKNKTKINHKSKNNYKKNSEYIKNKANEYYIENKTKISENAKNYRLEKSDEIKKNKKTHYLENRDYYLNYAKKYRLENTTKISEYKKLYEKKNPHIKSWRALLRSSLRRMNKPKENLTIEILGYSALELKLHIELLFTEGMSWNNHGKWHIDHIKPVSSFDLETSPSIVNALSNLQPLWASDNLSKKANY